MCTCNKNRNQSAQAPAQQWRVSYPDGSTAQKASEAAAAIAAAKVPGASYAKV